MTTIRGCVIAFDWPDEHLQYIREQMKSGELVAKIAEEINELWGVNYKPGTIYHKALRDGMYRPKRRRLNWTLEQKSFLNELKISGCTVDEIVKIFNEKYGTNYSRSAINNVVYRGRYHEELIKRRDRRAHPVGAEIFRAVGTARRWVIKIAEQNKWKLKSHFIWEKHYGPVKKGCVIRQIDGNPHNFAIENLEMVSRRLHMNLNKIHYVSLPAELKPSVKLIAELEIAISDRSKDR